MKTNQLKAVPKLRFPEFKGGADWEEKNLLDVADKEVKWSFIGGPFGSNLKASDYTNKGVRVIQLQNIGDGEFVNDSKIYTSVEKADELLANNIYPHDIIMSKMGDPVGRACIIPDTHDRYVMCSDGIRLVVDEGKYSKYFIYSFINSDTFRASVESKSTGSTRKRIGLSHLKSLPLLIPTLSEQKKIADCLSSLDDLIDAENEQLNTLKNYKAGLLQQLFPAEGETTPKRRFAEFDGDWEEVSLAQICEMKAGTFIPASEIQDTSKNDLYPCYGGNGLRGFTKTYTHNGLFPLVGRQGALCGNVNLINGDFYATEHALVCTPKPNIDVIWLYYQLVLLDLNKYATGQAQPGLSVKNLNDISLRSPINIQEQQKIAECLSSLDNIIQAKDKKIEALKQHKQGLMQQLFPVVEAE